MKKYKKWSFILFHYGSGLLFLKYPRLIYSEIQINIVTTDMYADKNRIK